MLFNILNFVNITIAWFQINLMFFFRNATVYNLVQKNPLVKCIPKNNYSNEL